MPNSQSTNTLQNTRFLIFLIVLEALFLVLMIKSFGLAVLFLLFIVSFFLVSHYPEFGMALAATGSLLIMVIVDNIDVFLPAPILIIYLFFIIAGLTGFILKENIQLRIKFALPQILCMLILAVLVFGYTYSANPSYGARKIAFYILFNLVLVSFPMLFSSPQTRIHHIGYWIYILGLILGVITTIITFDTPVYVRFHASENINPIWLARSLGISVIFAFYIIMSAKRRFLKLLVFASTFFLIYPMIRTWSRAPFLGMLACVMLLLILQPGIRKSTKVLFIATSIALGLPLMLKMAGQITSRLQTPLSEEWSAAFRVLAWVKAWKDFRSSPLLGIGTGSFKLELPFLPFQYPHNLILELASENGIVGLVLILLFLSATFFMGVATVRRSNILIEKRIAIVLLSAFIYATWNAMFSGDISSNESIWLFSGLICSQYLGISMKRTDLN